MINGEPTPRKKARRAEPAVRELRQEHLIELMANSNPPDLMRPIVQIEPGMSDLEKFDIFNDDEKGIREGKVCAYFAGDVGVDGISADTEVLQNVFQMN